MIPRSRTRLLLSALAAALLLLACQPAPAAARRSSATPRTVPADTRIPIRFLEAITSGRTPAHTKIHAQTLAPLRAGSCVLVPSFTRLEGTIEASKAGRTALQRGSLRIQFDSIQVAPARWLSISAVLDSLEWSPRRVHGGTAFSGRGSIAALAGEQLALLAADVAAAPVAGVEAARLARRPRVLILAGEEAVVRLTDPLKVRPPVPCNPETPASTQIPLPPLAPHAAAQDGTGRGDPINLVLVGGDEGVARAFAAANWKLVHRSTLPHLARGVWDNLLGGRDDRAPVSHGYYGGRLEDVAFERSSPSARVRHHVRLWKLEPATPGDTLWACAALEDVGLLFHPLHAPTHRIDRRIDLEREVVVRELLAGGGARLDGYAQLPGSVREGVTTHGQRFRTDALTAVLRMTPAAADSSE